jgi:hypothetical protein
MRRGAMKGRDSVKWRRLFSLMLMVIVASCGPRPVPPTPTSDPVPPPDPTDVESVLFLLGDPGNVLDSTSPVLTRLGQDIEWWADRLESDSAVAVIVLGDIIYPYGMRDLGTPEYDRDTTIVLSQVRLVMGPSARSSWCADLFRRGEPRLGAADALGGIRSA